MIRKPSKFTFCSSYWKLEHCLYQQFLSWAYSSSIKAEITAIHSSIERFQVDGTIQSQIDYQAIKPQYLLLLINRPLSTPLITSALSWAVPHFDIIFSNKNTCTNIHLITHTERLILHDPLLLPMIIIIPLSSSSSTFYWLKQNTGR